MTARETRVGLAILLTAIWVVAHPLFGKGACAADQSPRAAGRSINGEVVRVDSAAKTMSVRSGGALINFDISNPVLQGYGSLTSIRKGDRVGLSYTANGIRIARLGKGAPESPSVAEKQPGPAAKKQKKSLFVRRIKADDRSFSSVDNNKDGKISPIELSVIIPNLTVEQFRQYDRNNDGRLDRNEFEQIKLP